MTNPRKTAAEALLRVDCDGAYSNLVLDRALKDAALTARDAGLCTALFYGVLERRITLDHIIGKYSSKPLKKITPLALESLRLGLYQMLYMDKIPDRAAVDQSVMLIKNSREKAASGFVNAVLRSAGRDRENAMDFGQDETQAARALKYSVPEQLVALLDGAYGAEICNTVLQSSFGRPLLTVCPNPLKTTPPELTALLSAEGVHAQPNAVCPEALDLTGLLSGGIDMLETYRRGLFHVQDAAAQLCVKALDPQPGERVLDVCAAPGGKSFAAAGKMNNEGEIVACDLYPQKIKLLAEGASRLGCSAVHPMLNNAEKFNDRLGQFDRVLCDLPCSGLGILRRKPEIRYKIVTNLDIFPKLQYGILCISTAYVKQGGMLVYSTCTLNPAENSGVVKRFLQAHPEFEPLPVLETIPRVLQNDETGLTLFPGIHGTDGFYIAAFRKAGD